MSRRRQVTIALVMIFTMLGGSSASRAFTCFGVVVSVRSLFVPTKKIEIKRQWLPELLEARKRFVEFRLWQATEASKNFVGKTFQMHGKTWTITAKNIRASTYCLYTAENGQNELQITQKIDADAYLKMLDPNTKIIEGSVFESRDWISRPRSNPPIQTSKQIHFPGEVVKYGEEPVEIMEVLGWGAQGTVYKVRKSSGEIETLKVTQEDSQTLNDTWVKLLKEYGANWGRSTPKVKSVAPSHIFMEFIDGIPLDFFTKDARANVLALPAELRREILNEVIRTKVQPNEISFQEVLDIRTGRIYLVDPV